MEVLLCWKPVQDSDLSKPLLYVKHFSATFDHSKLSFAFKMQAADWWRFLVRSTLYLASERKAMVAKYLTLRNTWKERLFLVPTFATHMFRLWASIFKLPNEQFTHPFLSQRARYSACHFYHSSRRIRMLLPQKAMQIANFASIIW